VDAASLAVLAVHDVEVLWPDLPDRNTTNMSSAYGDGNALFSLTVLSFLIEMLESLSENTAATSVL
jgi:hypothetical protein